MKLRSSPHFELRSVYADGTSGAPELIPVTRIPWEAYTDRRGFLGAGITASAAIAMLSGSTAFAEGSSSKVGSVLRAHRKAVADLAFAPDGSRLATTSTDGSAKVWAMPGGGLLFCASESKQVFHGVAFPPPEDLLAVGSSTGRVFVYDLNRLKRLGTLKGHEARVTALLSAPRFGLLCSGSYDKTVRLWQLGEAREATTLRTHEAPVRVLALDGNSDRLASGSADGTIVVWSLSRRRRVLKLSGHKACIRRLAFGPKATLVSRDLTGMIVIWSTRTGKVTGTLSGPWRDVDDLVMTPDGKTLVTASKKNVELRAMPSGRVHKTFRGHHAEISALAISPDGQTLATGDRDGVVILWSLVKGKQLAQLFDADATGNKVTAQSFRRKDETTGHWITYTQPCGSPIPKAAICVCNCVPGRLAIKTTPSITYRPRNTPRHTGGKICTCNKVCICNLVPVCQAHRLLHSDRVVRRMAASTLLLMGRRELPYMRWAAEQSASTLRRRIERVIHQIEEGAESRLDKWLPTRTLMRYLVHEDRVVALMAAQLLKYLSIVRHVRLHADLADRIEDLVGQARRAPWYVTGFPASS